MVKECRNKTDSKNLATMKSRTGKILATKKYYCEDGMLNSFQRSTLPDCRERGLTRAKKCSESFHKTFRENKGSQALCRWEIDLFVFNSFSLSLLVLKEIASQLEDSIT